VTTAPDTHVASSSASTPSIPSHELDKIHSGAQRLTDDLSVDFQFSAKPPSGGNYPDYYEKMTAYVAILLSQAQAIEPGATARTYLSRGSGRGGLRLPLPRYLLQPRRHHDDQPETGAEQTKAPILAIEVLI
jgi:Uma2 family endonuclease